MSFTRLLPAVLAFVALACSSGDDAPATPTNDPAATVAANVSTPAVTDSPTATAASAELVFETRAYPVPAGSRPHDVAPAADGGVSASV